MKQSLVLLSLLALLSAAYAHQDPARPGRPRVARSVTFAGARPGWLDKEIDVSLKNQKLGDAVKQILKAAGKNVDKVEIDEGVASPQISVAAKGVKVRDALAAVGRLAGATAYVIDEDDKITVRMKKRDAVEVYTGYTISSSGMPAGARKEYENAMIASREALAQIRTEFPTIVSRPGGFSGAMATQSFLPDKSVSLDVKDQDVREILKTLLKQAEVDFVLEEDIPENKRHSFTFSNVSLRAALDVVCESVGVGWGVKRGEKKPLVHIGKKWAKKSLLGQTGFAPFPSFDTFDGFTSGFSFTLPEVVPPLAEFPTVLPTPPTTWGAPEIIL
jgi:type II secretory pathway component GspD/PulD (secretin)